MAGMLGADSGRFLAALAEPEAGLRVNPLRLSPERFAEISPFALEPLAYPPGGFRLLGGGRPGKHPYHAAGLYYLQDPGAMAVGEALGARPGERVLDLAAAPGGKATQLAGALRGEGVLVANDVHPTRARELAGNLERMGARNAVITSESADRLAAHFGAWFDRVLLDAPCSGESMFSKSEAARREWSPAAVEGCARRQEELLVTAAALVRPGGLLVYSTCTFSPEENEGAVAAFLRARPGFRVESMEVPGAARGRPDWAGEEAVEGLERTVRLWPHELPGAGHFIAALRRDDGDRAAVLPPARVQLPREAWSLLADFERTHLTTRIGLDRLGAFGEEIYRVPEGAPALGRLRVVRPGWWVGSLAKNRFEPAHALALGLDATAAPEPVVLGTDDPATHAYLRGESITAPGRAGWTPVAVDGFNLGWGKRVGSTVKNHYPKGLRWR